MEKFPAELKKTKIAAWILIGMGGLTALYVLVFLCQNITALVLNGPLSDTAIFALWVPTMIIGQSIFVAIASFLAGLLLFKQKRRILVFAGIIFLISFVVQLTSWDFTVAPVQYVTLVKTGCVQPACIDNNPILFNFFNWINYFYAFIMMPIICSFLAWFLVSGGLKIMKFNKGWWLAALTVMLLNIIFWGNFISSILTKSGYDNLAYPIATLSVIFSIAVVYLLFRDAEKFGLHKPAKQ